MARQRTTPMPALTASGEVIDTADRNASQRYNRRRGQWQQAAWNYRELIGELGAGLDYQADILSKVSYVVAAVGDDDEPAPLVGDYDKTLVPEHVVTAARDVLNRLPFRNGYAFTGIMSTCLRVAGECWLHGHTERRREQWAVLSSDEVDATANGFAIRSAPGEQPTSLAKGDALLRLWKPHPRYKSLPDSPMRRLLDTCEDIVLVGRELRAASRSRVAANGILLVPNSLSVVVKPDGVPDNFQAQLEVLMLAPIGNEGQAGAVVPVVLRGDKEDLEAVRHIVLAREDSPTLIAKLTSGLSRLRDGMSMPSDATSSVREMNHWSSWSVTQDNWKNYMEPSARLVVDSLTEAYLRPGLTLATGKGGHGLSEEDADRVQVWYDAGNVTENANRGPDMKDLYDRGEASGAALRSALGASEADAPDDDELRRMVTWKAASALTPELVAKLIGDATGVGGVVVATTNGQARTQRQVIDLPRRDLPAGGTAGTAPTSPVPRTAPPGATVASAASGEKVLDSERLVTADRLAEIERSLRDRLMVVIDAALLRAMERAGTRVRAQVQGKKDMAALAGQLKGVEPHEVCPLVGDRLGELSLSEESLLARAFERVREHFGSWTRAAIREVALAVRELLGLPLAVAAHLTDKLTARVDAGWRELETRLRGRALDLLYGRGGLDSRGEVPDSLARPGDIRAALAVVGGDGAQALALGGDVLSVMDEYADRVGVTWRYGITPRNNFTPHQALNKRRFTGWDDPALKPDSRYAWIGPHYRPGDHDGCLCDAVPTWLVPATRAVIRSEIERDNAGAAADRLLAQMDDDAGRTGTGAQRDRAERQRVLAIQHSWVEGTA